MTKKEFETKYEFLLAPDEPEAGVRKEFCKDLHKLTTLKRIQRCGNCGSWLDDPSFYTETEC